MPSEFVPRGDADTMFAAELSAALSKHGLRGAYAKKLQAEWLGHYANLRDTLPAEEAISRLGSAEDLAAAAARSRFEGRWWCAAPVVSGILSGFLVFLLMPALSVLPIFILSAVDASWAWDSAEYYACCFNWFGELTGLVVLGWLTGRMSNPPGFRRALIITFAMLMLMVSMDVHAPRNGPGTGWFTFGLGVDHHAYSSLPLLSVLLAFRLLIFAAVFRWCRRVA